MWSRRLLTVLQRARQSSHTTRLAIGGALGLVALAELDRRDESESALTKIAQTERSVRSVEEQIQIDEAKRNLVRTRQTVRRMEADSSKETLESRYDVDWKTPLGEGSFGVVYLGVDKRSDERVAVKKISKKYTNLQELQLEMRALLHLRQNGGHPNICSLRENFSEGDFYYLILDLVSGGEMFDHLVAQGAYSEADAARLVREVASALAFLHGAGVSHCDLKPENLMLSSRNPSDAVIKLIDFGCAVVDDEEEDASTGLTGRTLAYCPPEVLDRKTRPERLDPSVDMWALGIILYIMLTGIHPFDLSGQATDDEVAAAIVSGKSAPLRNSPLTAHLSDSAIDLIEGLMQRDGKKRLTADEMLEHPWTRGITASRDKMADSDKKLSMYRVYKSGIAEKVFANIVSWADDTDNDDKARRTSLIERSFRAFDPQKKGYLTRKDLQSVAPKTLVVESDDRDSARLSLSGFSDLLAENMKNRYFPKGKIVYREGDIGNAMYFINSGTVSVETLGSVAKRGPGDYFGEGALLDPLKRRSATIKCDTAVHAMEISREYFEQYLAKSDSALMLTLREKDKIRKRNRAKMILRRQENLKVRNFTMGEKLFAKGDAGDSLFLVESGKIRIVESGNAVFSALPGNVCGEHSLVTGRPRNSTAICGSKDGCMALEMMGDDFRKLTRASPEVLSTLRDLCIRRDFKKAVVLRLNKEFPYDDPRQAFDAVKSDSCRDLDVDAVGRLMRELNPYITEDEILEVIRTLDLTNSGAVTFDEFKKVFVADIRKSASI